jgi:hypothetical protein
MFFKQFAVQGMGRLSYPTGCPAPQVACVVALRRDVQVYIETARKDNTRIARIFEIHIHADHVDTGMERGGPAFGPRGTASFGGAHIPGNVNIGLTGQTANWIDTVVEPDADPILPVKKRIGLQRDTRATAPYRARQYPGISLWSIAVWQEEDYPFEHLWRISTEQLQKKLREQTCFSTSAPQSNVTPDTSRVDRSGEGQCRLDRSTRLRNDPGKLPPRGGRGRHSFLSSRRSASRPSETENGPPQVTGRRSVRKAFPRVTRERRGETLHGRWARIMASAVCPMLLHVPLLLV